MSEGERRPANVVMFAPEHWGEAERFLRFYRTTYTFNRRTTLCLHGVVSHFHKALRLRNLASRLAPGLEEDQKQLDACGYSPATNSKELAAIVETIYCEHYASIECTCHVLRAIYQNVRGVPTSARKLFENAVAGKIGPQVPTNLVDELRTADGWVGKLRALRDAVVHTEIGSCHLNGDAVSYMTVALRDGPRALAIPDVLADIDSYADQINQFLGRIFGYLNRTFADEETRQMCGIFSGRAYERYVRPSEATSFAAGRCKSYTWFEQDENPTCPFAPQCAAYDRAKSLGGEVTA